ncbi:MAG: TrmH family RNA methyltransferase [Brevefilum sp.]
MFEIRQCTHPDCHLRMPIDPKVHRGAYCPRCGAPMVRAAEAFAHRQPSGEAQPKRHIRVLLDNIRSAHNTGAIFRTADGVGAAHLYLCGITPNPLNNTALQKTALGAEEDLSWSAHLDAVGLAQALTAEGFRLLALETAAGSQPVFEVDSQFLDRGSIVLVVGNEQAGVDPGVLDLCDLALFLPMAGSKASLNAAVAFGIAAYLLAFI